MEYSGLKYKTNRDTNPQGKPRIYFCCHNEDFAGLFEMITDEILKYQPNAAVWYYDPHQGIPENQQFFDDLAQMQLFVVPVTKKFLYQDNNARQKEFVFALEHHIPVLPLCLSGPGFLSV